MCKKIKALHWRLTLWILSASVTKGKSKEHYLGSSEILS
jgi:hypothetical protein